MVEAQEIVSKFTSISQRVTNEIVDFLTSKGYTVTERWVGLLLFFVSLFLVFIAIRVINPWVKWGLVVLSVILIVGLVMPGW